MSDQKLDLILTKIENMEKKYDKNIDRLNKRLDKMEKDLTVTKNMVAQLTEDLNTYEQLSQSNHRRRN